MFFRRGGGGGGGGGERLGMSSRLALAIERLQLRHDNT